MFELCFFSLCLFICVSYIWWNVGRWVSISVTCTTKHRKVIKKENFTIMYYVQRNICQQKWIITHGKMNICKHKLTNLCIGFNKYGRISVWETSWNNYGTVWLRLEPVHWTYPVTVTSFKRRSSLHGLFRVKKKEGGPGDCVSTLTRTRSKDLLLSCTGLWEVESVIGFRVVYAFTRVASGLLIVLILVQLS